MIENIYYEYFAIYRRNLQDQKRIVNQAKHYYWRGSDDLLQVHENRPI
ncbi:hypothetical protein PROVALCAL_00305 [Providencia alcalifaciens DSM 30120]|uniref:Uncharacterized protein n=2 Tax=Providencia alcalifaciens TaxID=126385 RepID=B6XAF7_9GAMM|nr:hypothetical protein PROVALCAL_00305 [Providencia alcalifaciens DSM 30120]EUD12439.1 hypothetical protein HMPREF1563_3532 [Providencia alcalifaciens 205/92]